MNEISCPTERLCKARGEALRSAGLQPGSVSSILTWLTNLSRDHEFATHAYSFMPDHLHVLCEGLSDDSRLLDFLSRFKQQTAYEHRKQCGAPLWQARSHDHILRKADAMEDVAWYIWMNPVRKGLCTDPKQFPFSGSLTMPWNHVRPPTQTWQPPWKSPKLPG